MLDNQGFSKKGRGWWFLEDEEPIISDISFLNLFFLLLFYIMDLTKPWDEDEFALFSLVYSWNVSSAGDVSAWLLIWLVFNVQRDADSVYLLSHPDVRFPLPVSQPLVQLAHFRQRRAKSESSSTQKKTQKRKGQAVQTNERSAQERHLEESQTDDCHGEINKEPSEVCF